MYEIDGVPQTLFGAPLLPAPVTSVNAPGLEVDLDVVASGGVVISGTVDIELTPDASAEGAIIWISNGTDARSYQVDDGVTSVSYSLREDWLPVDAPLYVLASSIDDTTSEIGAPVTVMVSQVATAISNTTLPSLYGTFEENGTVGVDTGEWDGLARFDSIVIEVRDTDDVSVGNLSGLQIPSGYAGYDIRPAVTGESQLGALLTVYGDWVEIAAEVVPTPGEPPLVIWDPDAPLQPSDTEVVTLVDADDRWRIGYKITDATHGLYPDNVGAHPSAELRWNTGSDTKPVSNYHRTEQHPDFFNQGTEGFGVWFQQGRSNNLYPDWLDRTAEAGTTLFHMVDFTLDGTSWSGKSNTQGIEVPAAPDEPNPGPGPVLGEIVNMPFFSDTEADDGWDEGDGEQISLSQAISYADPTRCWIAGDVWGIERSDDAGRNLKTLENLGIRTPYNVGIGASASDPDRAIALMGNRANSKFNGLYLTTDGGKRWNMVHRFDYQLGEKRTALQRVRNSRADSNRWWCVLDSSDGFGGSGTINKCLNPALWTSTSNGADGTWTRVRTLPAGTFGEELFGVLDNPNDSSECFLWGQNGLYRMDSSGNYTRESNSGGLPTGTVYCEPWVSNNGQTIVVGVSGKGVFKSTNGGSSWSNIYNSQLNSPATITHYTFFDDQVGWCWAKSDSHIRFSNDGWQTWETCTVRGPHGNHGHKNEPNVMPDLRGGNRAFMHGNGQIFYTTNGKDFIRSNGHNGTHTKGYAPNSWCLSAQEFFIVLMDRTLIYTNNGGRTFQQRRRSGIGQSSCMGMTIHNDGQTLLIANDRDTRQYLERSPDKGLTWTRVESETKGYRHYVGFGRGNIDEDYAFQRDRRSTNKGQTWSTMGALPSNCFVTGVSLGTVNANYSRVFAVDTASGGSDRRIYASDNGGNSWSLVVDAGYDLTAPNGGWMNFNIHPTNPDIFYTKSRPSGGHAQIRRWDMSGSVSYTDFDIFNGGSIPLDDLYVDIFAIDGGDPDHMVARTNWFGTEYVLFESIDHGASWTNISGGWPTAANGRGLLINPFTGVIYIGGSGGGNHARNPLYGPRGNQGTVDLIKAEYPERTDQHVSAA